MLGMTYLTHNAVPAEIMTPDSTSVNALAMYLLLAVILGGWEAPHWWMNSAQDVEHCKVGS